MSKFNYYLETVQEQKYGFVLNENRDVLTPLGDFTFTALLAIGLATGIFGGVLKGSHELSKYTSAKELMQNEQVQEYMKKYKIKNQTELEKKVMEQLEKKMKFEHYELSDNEIKSALENSKKEIENIMIQKPDNKTFFQKIKETIKEKIKEKLEF
jgi:hypothetical protein